MPACSRSHGAKQPLHDLGDDRCGHAAPEDQPEKEHDVIPDRRKKPPAPLYRSRSSASRFSLSLSFVADQVKRPGLNWLFNKGPASTSQSTSVREFQVGNALAFHPPKIPATSTRSPRQSVWAKPPRKAFHRPKPCQTGPSEAPGCKDAKGIATPEGPACHFLIRMGRLENPERRAGSGNDVPPRSQAPPVMGTDATQPSACRAPMGNGTPEAPARRAPIGTVTAQTPARGAPMGTGTAQTPRRRAPMEPDTSEAPACRAGLGTPVPHFRSCHFGLRIRAPDSPTRQDGLAPDAPESPVRAHPIVPPYPAQVHDHPLTISHRRRHTPTP